MSDQSTVSPFVAVVLSVLMPGLGHIYLGRVAVGIGLFALTLVAYAMAVPPGLVVHAFVVIAAGVKASEVREEERFALAASHPDMPPPPLDERLVEAGPVPSAPPPLPSAPAASPVAPSEALPDAPGPPARPAPGRPPMSAAEFLGRIEELAGERAGGELTDEAHRRWVRRLITDLALGGPASKASEFLPLLQDLQERGMIGEDDLLRVKAIVT